MKPCAQCGRPLDDRAIICPNCGALQPLPPDFSGPSFLDGFFFPSGRPGGEESPENRGEVKKYLIWSMILVLLCSFFGFPGLMASMQALMEPNGEGRRRALKYARTFCIIGTVLTVIFFLFLFWASGSSPSAAPDTASF